MPALWTRPAVEMCTVQAAECTRYVRQMGMISSAMHLHWMSIEAFKDGVVGHKHVRTYAGTYVHTYIRTTEYVRNCKQYFSKTRHNHYSSAREGNTKGTVNVVSHTSSYIYVRTFVLLLLCNCKGSYISFMIVQ